jgi:hypothetical protein
MVINIKKIVLYDDLLKGHSLRIYNYKRLKEWELSFGAQKNLVDEKAGMQAKYLEGALFPDDKIIPIKMNFSPDTIYLLKLRSNYILDKAYFNPEIAAQNIIKEIFFINYYEKKKDTSLLYFFYCDKSIFASLNATIKKDNYGTVSGLISNPADPSYRKKIIDLAFNSETVTKGQFISVKPIQLKNNYSICSNGKSCDIIFGENYRINVINSNGIKLIVFYLKYPESNDSLTEIRKKLKLKLSDDNFDNTVKNIRDSILTIEEMEIINPAIKIISKEKRFSYYISRYLEFNFSKRNIITIKDMRKEWESLPEEF